MTTKSNTKPLTSREREELEVLKARLAELEAEKEIEENTKQLEPDDYISVMSLLPYPLNLTTKEFGQGNVKRFTKFGEVKKIMYRDLVDIIEAHMNFVEAGYFYILSPAFVRQNGLQEIYSKILTKDKIEEIITSNSQESINLYNSATKEQQEIIIDLLIGMARNNPDSLNLNVVDKISRLSKVDIMQKAEEALELEKPAE